MEDMITWQEVLTQIINAVVGILIPVLSGYAVLYARQGLQLLKLKVSDMNPDVFSALEYFSKEAVKYAEQTGMADAGEKKLEEAIAQVQRDLNEAGFGAVDLQLIKDKIEVALYDEINKHKQPALAG